MDVVNGLIRGTIELKRGEPSSALNAAVCNIRRVKFDPEKMVREIPADPAEADQNRSSESTHGGQPPPGGPGGPEVPGRSAVAPAGEPALSAQMSPAAQLRFARRRSQPAPSDHSTAFGIHVMLYILLILYILILQEQEAGGREFILPRGSQHKTKGEK